MSVYIIDVDITEKELSDLLYDFLKYSKGIWEYEIKIIQIKEQEK